MITKDKSLEYASKIIGALSEMFDEDSDSDFKIYLEELSEGDNLTELFHAMANIAPAYFYKKFTNDEKQALEFNHLANQLCFKFALRDEREQDVKNEKQK